MTARHSTDLVGWAVAMEVGDDQEALSEVHRMLGRLLDANDRIAATSRAVRLAPSDEAKQALATALERIDLAVLAIEDVLRGFANHERGR